MKDNWGRAFDLVLKSEGGFQLTNIANDNGGQTYAGIARVPNPNWEGWRIIDRGGVPPRSLVADFYKANFWDRCHCDDMPAGLDYAVFDFAVNAGTSRAIKYMQRALGVTDDGVIGPKTIAAMKATDPRLALDNFSAAKSSFYKALVDRDPAQRKFIKGWLARVDHVQHTASDMVA